MTRHRFATTAAVLGGLALGAGPSSAQLKPGSRASMQAKLDTVIIELGRFIPNRGLLTLGAADTLVYTSVMSGRRRIPLNDVELFALPDSQRTGFRCRDPQPCIAYDVGLATNARETQFEIEVSWVIGTNEMDDDRKPKFVPDPPAAKRVHAALTLLMSEQVLAPSIVVGPRATPSRTSAQEMAVRIETSKIIATPESHWTRMLNNPEVAVYVDLVSVVNEGATRLAWVRTKFTPAQQIAIGMMSMAYVQQRFDCAKRRTQMIQSITILHNEVVARAAPPGDSWNDASAPPPVLATLERVCGVK